MKPSDPRPGRRVLRSSCGACLLLAAFAALAFLTACASTRSPPPLQPVDADYPGELRPASDFPADVLLRQRVSASWGDAASGDPRAHGQRSFDCAFQKQGDTLTLLGLSPLGSVTFVVKLVGDRVEFENRTPEPLPFPPRFILLDVERVFFPWLATGGAPLVDGVHESVLGDERVTERWSAGQLVERRFERIDGHPAGAIRITFGGDREGRFAPPSALLDNGWLNYRLSVETYEQAPLPTAVP
ncbi:MAG TPA: DUF3261 domain-containing protein [Planctomycetota bacterium]|nr:DUF3261 domain-containing protein [Planctomycetota bacterium]